MKCDDCIYPIVCGFKSDLEIFWKNSNISRIENKGQAADRAMLYSKIFEILDFCGHYKKEDTNDKPR